MSRGSLQLVTLILLSLLMPLFASPLNGADDSAQHLALGKMSLDKGDAQTAIEHLSTSIDRLPQLADYALYWRALSYVKLKDTGAALRDLRMLMDKHRDSPLLKRARTKEIEILKMTDEEAYQRAVEAYLKEYPSDYAVKFAYAQHLKGLNEDGKSRRLFKEVFINANNSLASRALSEIGEENLSAEDLLKKANNLNKAWYFSEAERYFKEAKKKDKKGLFRSAIREGLAYSYFRQKRYKESAELYRERGDLYWYGRSLLRAKEIAIFEENLKRFKESDDKRMLQLLIAYGNIKRRAGDVEASLKIFNELLRRYPDKKEQEHILWAIAWTQYLQRDYEKALPLFVRLNDQYGDGRYGYWMRKTQEHIGKTDSDKRVSVGYRDYYGYLTAFKSNQPVKGLSKTYSPQNVPAPLQRAEILLLIGLKEEAIVEAVHSVRVSGGAMRSPAASAFLHKVGNHRYAVNIISRTPYQEEYHNLLYPFVFTDDIEEAARQTGLDHMLILSVIREESRYDPEARSIAGAMGLMQLMPATARLFAKHAKVSLRGDSELYEPKKNISIGSHYLRHLIDHFGSLPPAIAAYNAGEEPVREWLKKGNYKSIDEFIEDIPYDETNNYVKKVLTTYFEHLRAKEAPLPDPKLMGM